jgi:hypothetical protein
MIAPSGEQITIALEDQQAVIVGAGGGLRSYFATGRKLVDGYGAHEMSSFGAGSGTNPVAVKTPGGRAVLPSSWIIVPFGSWRSSRPPFAFAIWLISRVVNVDTEITAYSAASGASS